MAKEKRWVIVGEYGLYTGQEFTRASAIAAHVYSYRGWDGIPHDISEFAFNGLSDSQRAAWKLRKKAGDRAIHAIISY